MQEAMILKGETLKDFHRIMSKFILTKTEYQLVCLHESATDSEHVHRVSVFVCDKEHDWKDARFLDELEKYLHSHFPEDETLPPVEVASTADLENQQRVQDALKQGYGIDDAQPY
jgi:hypothetical protein